MDMCVCVCGVVFSPYFGLLLFRDMTTIFPKDCLSTNRIFCHFFVVSHTKEMLWYIFL